MPPVHGQADNLPQSPQWWLTRRCALTPGQLLLSYAAMVTLSAATALVFGWQGLWLVPLYCLVQVLAAGAMYLVHMLHAVDGEHICFSPDGQLTIAVMRGLTTRHYCMNPLWTRLERDGPRQERLWLCCSPLRVPVASQLALAERRRVERELRQALLARQAGQAIIHEGHS